jgi:hypothetical protein
MSLRGVLAPPVSPLSPTRIRALDAHLAVQSFELVTPRSSNSSPDQSPGRADRHRTILFALGGSDLKLLTNLDSVAVKRDPALQEFHVTDGQPDGTPAPSPRAYGLP